MDGVWCVCAITLLCSCRLNVHRAGALRVSKPLPPAEAMSGARGCAEPRTPIAPKVSRSADSARHGSTGARSLPPFSAATSPTHGFLGCVAAAQRDFHLRNEHVLKRGGIDHTQRPVIELLYAGVSQAALHTLGKLSKAAHE